jgi:hypothetical protein
VSPPIEYVRTVDNFHFLTDNLLNWWEKLAFLLSSSCGRGERGSIRQPKGLATLELEDGTCAVGRDRKRIASSLLLRRAQARWAIAALVFTPAHASSHH